MNLKMRIKFTDILKFIFGGCVLVCDGYNNSIYRLQKGEDAYVTKA